MSEWQPIETAPKDGSIILVFCRGTYLGAAYCAVWSTDKDYQWRAVAGHAIEKPTHWQPPSRPA